MRVVGGVVGGAGRGDRKNAVFGVGGVVWALCWGCFVLFKVEYAHARLDWKRQGCESPSGGALSRAGAEVQL